MRGYPVFRVPTPMLHLHECVEPAPAESTAKPLHSIGDYAAVEESAVEPLHFADDPTTVESTAESLQSVADSDTAVDAPIETSYS
jgi:hypothetical protein